ncbi:MAG: hypothetical protein RL757_859 [Bacteroidota bacterium]|jgi:MraZ protein
MMLKLLGEFDCTMDAKGRVRLPSQLTRQLGEQERHEFVLARGLEKHLNLYPIPTWERITKELEGLNLYDKDSRLFVRMFHNGATPTETDEQGRILLNKRLVEFAGIGKEIILFAYNDRIEIWAADEYEKMMQNPTENVSDLAQKVLGNKQYDLLEMLK